MYEYYSYTYPEKAIHNFYEIDNTLKEGLHFIYWIDIKYFF